MLEMSAREVWISMRKRGPIIRLRMENPHHISLRPLLHTAKWTNQNSCYNSTWFLNFTPPSTTSKSGTLQICHGWLPYVDKRLDYLQAWIQLLIQRAQTGWVTRSQASTTTAHHPKILRSGMKSSIMRKRRLVFGPCRCI